MRGKWNLLLILTITQLGLIGALLLHARAMQSQDTAIAANVRALHSAPSPASERLALIESDNNRLKKDLATIPALQDDSKRLENQIAAESAKTAEIWMAQSNRLQTAIEHTRQQIAEIEAWEKNYNNAQMRERASARLAQKASANLKTPAAAAAEYVQLELTLKQISDRMKNQLAVRREWANTEKTPESRDEFKRRLAAAWTGLEAATKQLGEDSVLFEELPVTPNDLESSKTPLLRSVVPDLHGVTATLYLDGTIEWSPPFREALGK